MAVIGKTYPKICPLTRAVYWHYKQWRTEGVIEKLMNVLHGQVRSSGEKKAKWTTLIIIDSQAVKNTCNASIETKGFCHYKCTNGIKRHLAVDSLGLPFFTHCTPANVSDDRGLIELLSNNLDYFRAKPVNIPKITILLDHGYHPDTIRIALQQHYPQVMTKLKFQLAPKPTKAEKAAQGKSGFVPVATRWIVERSNAWMERCKRRVKNEEANVSECDGEAQSLFYPIDAQALS